MPHSQQRRVGRSVVAHLTWTFGVCLTALVAVVATSTITGFSRERDRAAAQLRAGADGAAAALGDSMDEILGFLAPVARQPVLTSFEPDSCRAAFAGFSGFLETSGHIHLLRADGHEVCSVVASGHEGHAFVAGDWLARVVATGQPALEQPADDPISGKLASTIVIPVDGDDGTRGVLAAVFYVGIYDLELPADLPDQTELLVLDPEGTRVVQASDSAAPLVGRSLAGTGFDRLPATAAATVPGFDGRERLAVRATVPDSNLTVVVALPPATAMAAARKQLQQALLIGGISLLIVAGLGLALHRRLGRPIRRLTGSIRAAGRGDEDTWAPVEGPAELAEMAEAFNEMLGERRAREAELRHRALHDVLTGLPNRAAARSCLARVLAEGRTAAVLFLDLDRFKLINDTHGHAVGDSLLVALGARLRGTTRTGCTVARFGGDEFVVLSPDTTEEDALAVAERLRDALEGCFRVEGHDLFVTGSVGVAVGHPGDVPDEVLRDADTAMYRAKDQGRPGYAFFDQDMRARSVWRLEMEQDLHLALDRGELMLHYQPIFDAASGSLAGVEALLRWNHPTRGMVSPADFIPIAEETGLIVPIGDWVLEEACRQSAAWRRAHRRGLTVSVNLAARQLTRPELADIVARALAQAGAQPTDLVLEITEHGVLEDFASAFTHLQQVRALGVKVSVDDFGTGWSSLTYLQRLPVDEMKIDRSFISSLGGDSASSAIVGSLVAMAHGLGLRVVAEGVETPEQLSALRRFGCDLAQGFLLARPGPAAAIDGLVRRPEVAA